MPNKPPIKNLEGERDRLRSLTADLQKRLDESEQRAGVSENRLAQTVAVVERMAEHQNAQAADDQRIAAALSSPDPEADPEGARLHQMGAQIKQLTDTVGQLAGAMQQATNAGAQQSAQAGRQAAVTTFTAKQPEFSNASAHLKQHLLAAGLPNVDASNVDAFLGNYPPEQIWDSAGKVGFKPGEAAPANGDAPKLAPADQGVPPASIAAGKSPTPSAPGFGMKEMDQDAFTAMLTAKAIEAGIPEGSVDTHILNSAEEGLADSGHLTTQEGDETEWAIGPLQDRS